LDWEIEEQSADMSYIRFYYSGNFFSFGNTIEYKVLSNSNSNSSLTILSKSAAQVQLIDWGVNEKLETDL
jgi:hypothetical protein